MIWINSIFPYTQSTHFPSLHIGFAPSSVLETNWTFSLEAFTKGSIKRTFLLLNDFIYFTYWLIFCNFFLRLVHRLWAIVDFESIAIKCARHNWKKKHYANIFKVFFKKKHCSYLYIQKFDLELTLGSNYIDVGTIHSISFTHTQNVCVFFSAAFCCHCSKVNSIWEKKVSVGKKWILGERAKMSVTTII